MTTVNDMEVPAVGAAPAEVFEFVYGRYLGRVTHYLYGMVQEWQTAEDLAAEMFLKLWRDMSERGFVIDGPDKAYSLLTVRAKFHALNHFQTAHQRRSLLVGFSGAESDHSRIQALAAQLTTDGPESTVVSREDLRRVVESLPDPQQKAILLRYLLDMAPDQVAQFTGWPPSKVTFYTTSALSALRTNPLVAESLGHDPQASAGPVARRTRLKGPADFSPALAARHQASAEHRARAESLICDLIRVGNLPAGTRLPSTRQMGERCGLSGSVMSRVMGDLAERGILVRDGAKRYCVAGQAKPEPTRQELAAERIREYITTALASGVLSPNQPIPTTRVLADLCGVSTATVQLALGRLHAARFLTKSPTGRYSVGDGGCAQQPAAHEATAERIREHLTNALASGEMTPGQELPAQSALATLFQVSRPIVTRALAALNEARFLAKTPTGRYLVAA